MSDLHDFEGVDESGNGSVDWLSQAPKIADALKRGTRVSVVTWGEHDVSGLVCDREQTGLLLDVHETEHEEEAAYLFIPWASVLHVRIESVAQRRVKSLP